MFDAAVEVLDEGRVHLYRMMRQDEPLLYDTVLALWQYDAAFRDFFITLLAQAPFKTYRWETPPITKRTMGRAFEFVLLNSPGLAQTPDERTFARHFSNEGAGITVFANLGRDATLIVPSPRAEPSAYRHLAVFMREAPEVQRHALWRAVGATVQDELSEAPLWLSTAGGGVSWLHVRLDARPKYYRFRPYQAFPKNDADTFPTE